MSGINEVIQHAARNGGIITSSEALAIGIPESTLRRRIADGILVRVSRGVLALPGAATRPDLELRAAMRALNAIVSHESAAQIHGLAPIIAERPTVSVSHRSTHQFPGLVVHQSTDLVEGHIEVREGLRITTPPRTIIDLAQVVHPARLERVVDNALASGKVDILELNTLFNSLARKGKKGTKALRAVITRRVDDPPTESTLETELLQLLERAGLPEPVRQFKAPWLKPIDGRVDLAYTAERVVVEGDSRRWHALFEAFETDRRRDNAAQLAGWIVLRFTWRMIRSNPTQVASTVRQALRDRGR